MYLNEVLIFFRKKEERKKETHIWPPTKYNHWWGKNSPLVDSSRWPRRPIGSCHQHFSWSILDSHTLHDRPYCFSKVNQFVLYSEDKINVRLHFLLDSYIHSTISKWYPHPFSPIILGLPFILGCPTIPWSSRTTLHSPSIKGRSPSTIERYELFSFLLWELWYFLTLLCLACSPLSHIYVEGVCSSLPPGGNVCSLALVIAKILT